MYYKKSMRYIAHQFHLIKEQDSYYFRDDSKSARKSSQYFHILILSITATMLLDWKNTMSEKDDLYFLK
jgi:hypothetical protein